MLILARKPGERVLISFGGVDIWLTIMHYRGRAERLGFEAPAGVNIMREELLPVEQQYQATHPEK